MVGNGYRTANLPPSKSDNRFAFAATNYWDPLGEFGRQIVDYDNTCDPLVRLGHSDNSRRGFFVVATARSHRY